MGRFVKIVQDNITINNPPPMLEAAIPVLAVTATASALLVYFLRRAAMIVRKSNDLPVPATKEKKYISGFNERVGMRGRF